MTRHRLTTKQREESKVPLLLRLPSGLHQRIKQTAAKNNTSLNREIINRLANSFTTPDVAKAIIKEIRRVFG